MDPYEILRINTTATDHEIKKAYRTLVKQYHPDKNKSEEAKVRVVQINAAYEILSDPVKRTMYHNPVCASTEEHAEDAVEAYKREFKRQRWEKEQRVRDQRHHKWRFLGRRDHRPYTLTLFSNPGGQYFYYFE